MFSFLILITCFSTRSLKDEGVFLCSSCCPLLAIVFRIPSLDHLNLFGQLVNRSIGELPAARQGKGVVFRYFGMKKVEFRVKTYKQLSCVVSLS